MTTNHLIKKVLLVTIFGAMTACTPRISVTSDFERDTDFTSYQTFAMAPMEEPYDPAFPMFDNEMNRKRVEEAIVSEMKALGYSLHPDHPDVLVDFHIVIKDRTSLDTYHPEGKGFWQAHEVEVYQYTEGTIVIHMVDQKTDQLIWQGVAASLLRSSSSNVEERIKKAVGLIYDAYPATP